MVQRNKLELELNKKTEVTLLYDDCISGENRYGPYYLFAVESNGAEYSFFPNQEVYSQIKHLRRGESFFITKSAKASGKKLITDYVVEIPVLEKAEAMEFENEINSAVSNIPTINEMDNTEPTDRFYDIMLQSYRDALNISKELNGNANVPQIATTLFIARSRTNGGIRYE